MSAGRRRLVLFWLCAAGLVRPAGAIDNPDAPDRSADFLARAQPYEERLAATSGGAAAAQASAEYLAFLDTELNQAYRLLSARLGPAARQELTRSQRQWLRFREAESRFIERNWNAQDFGSSAALSRAGYRAALVRQRVLGLLDYLRNYAD